ncbi:MAG TPA: CmcJ/NvfI family oxidoreductase [Candidatus Binataceae bacterium]|nr:CmcJ/NvfI family oxidoreductase [Candidatus Binataceae bacterium]
MNDVDQNSSNDAVETSLLYLVDPKRSARDHRTGWPGGSAPYPVTIANARKLINPSLDREGFMPVRHQSSVANFYDADEVRRTYYPELMQLLMRVTGASKVVIFAHDVRNSDASKQDGDKIREPVSAVHNDYTPKSAPQMVRENLPPDEAEDRLSRRFAEINIWRPLRGPVLARPLAICDARSIAPEDLVPTDRYLKHEVYMMTPSPAHRWFYFPRMLAGETLLIKGYDSMLDGRARFTAHASFVDPATPPDAPPRESIEARALLFFSS